MSFDKKIFINDDDRREILNNFYLVRCHSCNRVLTKNNIPREVSQLRRVFKLICLDVIDDNVINQAVNLLEDYMNSFNKEIEFDKLDETEINELFLDSCYDYKNLTVAKAIQFFEHGADINYYANGFRKPFFYVAKSSDLNLVREFLIRGANVNEKLENQTGTIWNTSHSCNYEKIKLFVEFGAEINSETYDRRTILHDLCESHTHVIDSLKYLSEKGADFNLKDSSGNSLLHLAVFKSREETVNFLIQKGLDVNLLDNNRDTPLIIATRWHMGNIVKLLIENGADKSLKNLAGETAYQIALNKKFLDIAQIFDSENAIRDYENRPEHAEIQKIKKQIIDKFKSGSKMYSSDHEGNDIFEFKDGVYKHTYYDRYEDLQSESIFKTDDEALKHLLCHHYKDELQAYKDLLNSI